MRQGRDDGAAIEQIQDLILQWYLEAPVARLHELPDPEDFPAVPDQLAVTITSKPGYRDAALSDARLWCACPRFIGGPGMDVELAQPVALEPFEQWSQAVSPVQYTLSWWDSMDPQALNRHRLPMTWQRVALEEGHWRIVELLDDTTRQWMLDQYLMLYQSGHR